MITVAKNQAALRWDNLPDSLLEALCSEANSEFIWKTCAAENIPDEKIYDAIRIAGYVIMGFLHPEDFAEEFTAATNIDQRTAKNVQEALITRIFSPIRADLEKVYAPLSKLEMSTNVITLRPSPAASAMPAAPAPLGAIKPSIAAAAPVKSPSFSDIGWSRTNASGPVVKLDTSAVPPSANTAPVKPAAPAPAGVPGPARSSMDEFERITMMKKAPPAPGTAPAAPGAPAEPAPFMLHHDTTFTASAQSNTSFTLNKAENARVPMPTSKPAPAIPRPAVLELGVNTTNAPKAPAAPGGVTHYTDFKPSLSSVPTATSGPRNVTQIVPPTPPAPTSTPAAPAPQIPVPPKPPTPPAPKGNGTAPQSDVIVKNFP